MSFWYIYYGIFTWFKFYWNIPFKNIIITSYVMQKQEERKISHFIMLPF